MLTNINPYHMQWNTDVNGNPISVHKQETQQVSPVYFNIQLDEIPDSFHRLVVVDTEGNMLHEVDNFNRITEQSYYVDYNNGVVYFHQTKGASIVNVTYYGRGFKLIRHEVDNFNRITEQSYYVDYNNGVVYFHQTKGASIVNVTYYGRGFKLIRSSRIVMDDGTKLTDALTQSQVQTASSVGSETEMSLQEQIDTVCKFVRKQQKIIEMLVEEIEKLQK